MCGVSHREGLCVYRRQIREDPTAAMTPMHRIQYKLRVYGEELERGSPGGTKVSSANHASIGLKYHVVPCWGCWL